MTDQIEIAAKITHFIEQVSPTSAPLASDQEILESGIVDSLSVMRLIAFVEREFDVALPMMDLTIDNLSTANAIAWLVSEHVSS